VRIDNRVSEIVTEWRLGEPRLARCVKCHARGRDAARVSGGADWSLVLGAGIFFLYVVSLSGMSDRVWCLVRCRLGGTTQLESPAAMR